MEAIEQWYLFLKSYSDELASRILYRAVEDWFAMEESDPGIANWILQQLEELKPFDMLSAAEKNEIRERLQVATMEAERAEPPIETRH